MTFYDPSTHLRPKTEYTRLTRCGYSLQHWELIKGFGLVADVTFDGGRTRLRLPEDSNDPTLPAKRKSYHWAIHYGRLTVLELPEVASYDLRLRLMDSCGLHSPFKLVTKRTTNHKRAAIELLQVAPIQQGIPQSLTQRLTFRRLVETLCKIFRQEAQIPDFLAQIGPLYLEDDGQDLGFA